MPMEIILSQVCLKWQNEQSEPFSTVTFPGVDHAQMVANTAVLEAITEIVGAPMPSSPRLLPLQQVLLPALQ